MNMKIDESWKNQLTKEFEKSYFIQLVEFIKSEYLIYKIFPSEKQIFSAFDHCSFDETKVVIIGQDPYHGDGQANGLCFSVADGIRKPPSLMDWLASWIYCSISSWLSKKWKAARSCQMSNSSPLGKSSTSPTIQ